MFHPQGNRIGFFGASDTGKSYLAMKFAEYLANNPKAPKRIIIYENVRNDETYGNVEKYGSFTEIHLNAMDYVLPKKGRFRVISSDLDTFIEKCKRLTNSIIVVDDATSLFRKNVPDTLIQFLGLRKNQRLEIMFQLHTFKETAPSLLENLDILVIKQTGDSLPVKDTCPNRDNVTKLIKQCQDENAGVNFANFWATRVYIPASSTVYKFDSEELNFEKSFKHKTNLLIKPL
jgi:hypothetical protein